jgi:hypothetical protein
MKKFLTVFLFIFITTDQSPVQFIVPELSVPTSPTIELPVVIQTNGNTVGSLEFALNYDESILKFNDIFLSEKAQQWLTYTMDTGSGKVRWGGYDSSFGDFNITEPSTLFTLTFDVLNNNWNETPITIGRKTAGTKLGWDLSVTNTDGYINYNRFSNQETDNIFGKVYPIPTNGTITLDLTIPKAGDYIVRIINLNGRVIKQKSYRLFQGYVSIQEDLYSLPLGIYLLQIINDEFVKTFKIIKQ